LETKNSARRRAELVNQSRGEMAMESLQLYRNKGDLEVALTDFLTDVLHAAPRLREVLSQLCEEASATYDREREAAVRAV